MTDDAAYKLAEHFVSLVSSDHRYALGRAIQAQLTPYEAGCIVSLGDGSNALACVSDKGELTLLTYVEPMLTETTCARFAGAVLAVHSRLASSASKFVEMDVTIEHEAFPGGSMTIPVSAIEDGSGQAVIDSIRGADQRRPTH